MQGLSFRVTGAAPVAFAMSPLVAFTVDVENADASRSVQSGLVRCQVQIDAAARPYGAGEARRLHDLFGEGPVWGRAIRRLLWTQTTAVLPSFTGRCSFEIHAPCVLDPTTTPAVYFDALSGGTVPVAILFSGTVFSSLEERGLQASPLPWSTEARFAMPAATWHEAVDRHYGGNRPVSLRRDLLERLARYGRRAGFTSLEEAVESLLPADEGAAS